MPSLKKFESSFGIFIDIEPWFSWGFRFINLKLHEELGGELAHGELNLTFVGDQDCLKLMTDQYTGRITISQRNNSDVEDTLYKLDFFITGRSFEKNSILLNFVCISDKKFFTELKSIKFNNISDALNLSYPANEYMKIDIRCDSDLNNDIPIIQFSETDQSFCTKLAYSYKKDSIFAFGFDGFFIKERFGKNNSKGKNETENTSINVINGMDTGRKKSILIPYDSILFEDVNDPWEIQKIPYNIQNLRTLKLFDNYSIIGTSYQSLMSNYMYNIAQSNTSLFSNFSILSNNIPKYRLGDVINWIDQKETLVDRNITKLPYTKFLVCSNELFVTADKSKIAENGSGISWTSRVVGLEQFGKILPKEDSTDNLDKKGSII